MQVAQIMTPYPRTLGPDDSIRRAAQIMRDEDIGVIPIVDAEGILAGIITDRDIAVKAVAEGRDADDSLEDCMTRQPDTVPGDTTVEQAMALMSRQQIRRLPVVENGRLIGIVSLGDIATSAVPEQEKAETLQEVSVNAEALRTSTP